MTMSDDTTPHEHTEPKGTLVITLLFLAASAAVFIWLYYLLISRR